MPNDAEPGDEREHVVAAGRVETARRLVEQHELGIADDRLRELRALAHAGRELADRAEPRFVEADEVEDVGGALARRACGQPAQLAERRDDVGRGLVERQAVVLGHVAEPRPHADRIARDVDAAHLDAALGRVREAEQEAERRGLARAVRADEADATARHLERQVVERGRARVALGQSVEAEEGSGVHEATSLSRGHAAVIHLRGEDPEDSLGDRRRSAQCADTARFWCSPTWSMSHRAIRRAPLCS